VDSAIESFRDRILGRERERQAPPIAADIAGVIDSWAGDEPAPLAGAPVDIPLADTYRLYWLALLASESSPHYEWWVHAVSGWQIPSSTELFAVKATPAVVAIGSAKSHEEGWLLMWGCPKAAATLAGVPEGTAIEFATAASPEEPSEGFKPEVGRALYSGVVRRGALRLQQMSPALDRQVLDDLLAFVTDLTADQRLEIRNDEERAAFDAEAGMFASKEGALSWSGNTVRINEDDERTWVLLARPVFRKRFSHVWPCEEEEKWF
jgi:hypothetical protein